MADILLKGSGLLSCTCVPNIFIDKYMITANGEYIKIYLYLLRSMNQSGTAFSVSMLADIFEHTEKDILRALLYWEKANLLCLDYNDLGEITSITLTLPEQEAVLNTAVSNAAKQQTADTLSTADSMELHTKDTTDDLMAKGADTADTTTESAYLPSDGKEIYTTEQLESFQDDESVQEILFITENYLGRTLNSTDIRTILYWYDGLHFSTDLIEYLIETCISNGHTSLRYMEKIALSWAEAGISSVAQARAEHSAHHQDVYAVMNAFGIHGRNLIPAEIKTIQKWTGQYAFSMDIIKEACRRTIQSTGKASFEYADTILNNWHKNNVHNMNDIIKLDAAHQKSKAAAKSKATASQASANNRFNNFPQRSYNYDQLEKQLLKTN